MPTALITGANRGIVFEFPRQYSADGWRVYAGTRNLDSANGLQGLDQDLVSIHQLDVDDHDQIKHLSSELSGISIDLLINNAGMWIGENENYGKFTDEQWMQQFRTHLFGTMGMCEAFVDNVANSDLKQIVNISSGNGCFGIDRGKGLFPYDSSKAALNLITKGLSVDLKDRGITVISFTPGFVSTDMSGPDADITPQESIAGMRSVIAGLSMDKTGTFTRYNGVELPW